VFSLKSRRSVSRQPSGGVILLHGLYTGARHGDDILLRLQVTMSSSYVSVREWIRVGGESFGFGQQTARRPSVRRPCDEYCCTVMSLTKS